MKKVTITVVACLAFVMAFAQPKANFSIDKFEGFTLHTYASFDPMADVSFIVESKDSLVIIEPQAFKGKVEEFVNYTNQLSKPIAKVIVSYHSGGLKNYADVEKISSKAMADFVSSDAFEGMLGYFNQAFNGAMDTEIVPFDKTLNIPTTLSIDGVEYTLTPSAVPGMPGFNIAIGDKVYYQHFAPAKGFHASKNMINSKAAIDGALTDAKKAKKGKYTLLLASHGYGKANADDLKFQIKYLKKMRKIANKASSENEFVAMMTKAYPNYKGEEDLKGIAQNIYKMNKPKQTKTQVLEVTSFQLKTSANTSDFNQLDAQVEADFTSKQPGFIKRQSGVDEKGKYVVLVYWKTIEDAKASMAKFMQDKAVADYASMIDGNSMKMGRYTIKDEFKADNSTFVEVMSFETKEGTDMQSFDKVNKKVETDFTAKKKGFLQRITGVNAEGRQVVIVYWDNKTNSDAALQPFMNAPVSKEFMGMMKQKSIEMGRYETLK